MENTVEKTPNIANEAVSLFNDGKPDEGRTNKFDYSSIREKVVYFIRTTQYQL